MANRCMAKITMTSTPYSDEVDRTSDHGARPFCYFGTTDTRCVTYQIQILPRYWEVKRAHGNGLGGARNGVECGVTTKP